MGPLDVLQWVGETLDKPGAAVRGLLAGRPDQLANLIPFSDTLGITDPKTRTYGRDLLEQYGLLGDNTPGLDAGDVAGFGVDMLTDPLNWIGGLGAAKKLAGINRANRSSQAMRAAGAMPEELIPLTKAVDESGLPKKLFHGTGNAFDRFDPAMFGKVGESVGPGVYLTDNPSVANVYANMGKNPNIRPHFVDARNPLIENTTYYVEKSPWPANAVDESAMNLAKAMGYDTSDVVTSRIGNIQTPEQAKKLASGIKNSFLENRSFGGISDEALGQLDEAGAGSLAEKLVSDLLSGKKMHTRDLSSDLSETVAKYGGLPDSSIVNSEPIRGGQLIQMLKRRNNFSGEMNKLGFDSVQQADPGFFGSAPSNVTVALDPSQVYAPYVAPSMRNIGEISPLLAEILGRNTLAAAGRY